MVERERERERPREREEAKTANVLVDLSSKHANMLL
jgi:hypothetical protein